MPTMYDYLGTLEVNAQVLLVEIARLRKLQADGQLPNTLTEGDVWSAENYVLNAINLIRRHAPRPPIFTL